MKNFRYVMSLFVVLVLAITMIGCSSDKKADAPKDEEKPAVTDTEKKEETKDEAQTEFTADDVKEAFMNWNVGNEIDQFYVLMAENGQIVDQVLAGERSVDEYKAENAAILEEATVVVNKIAETPIKPAGEDAKAEIVSLYQEYLQGFAGTSEIFNDDATVNTEKLNPLLEKMVATENQIQVALKLMLYDVQEASDEEIDAANEWLAAIEEASNVIWGNMITMDELYMETLNGQKTPADYKNEAATLVKASQEALAQVEETAVPTNAENFRESYLEMLQLSVEMDELRMNAFNDDGTFNEEVITQVDEHLAMITSIQSDIALLYGFE
ncbi:hypothetical protein [Rubeoparvulum massiliense]|uniref:hypothetical protein n=1 Tax=Rubeoparvulum massiliense TaxID=1631346 RepID=UPI00065E3229|nr:hypothetical protein [Rubeoparvulum massiliense]